MKSKILKINFEKKTRQIKILVPDELESSEDVGRLAAFLNDEIQLFRMPSVMAEKIILFPSNV